MTYGFEAFGFPAAPFTDGPLIYAMEFGALNDLRDEVFHAFYSSIVGHIKITHAGERRMVVNCAQFDADYMKDAPQPAGD